MNAFQAFLRPPRPEWFSVGLASSFPDVGQDPEDPENYRNLAQPRPCDSGKRPGCKAFYAPLGESTGTEVAVGQEALEDTVAGDDLKDQVLVFQYKGKIHAIDHRCPHASFPLSQGSPFDIEDFGVVLSAGLTCPKHGWSFDLFRGNADRGRYELGVWEVQLRDPKGAETPASAGESAAGAEAEKEVWVRRKPKRIG